jgi:hypothetical protein
MTLAERYRTEFSGKSFPSIRDALFSLAELDADLNFERIETGVVKLVFSDGSEHLMVKKR